MHFCRLRDVRNLPRGKLLLRCGNYLLHCQFFRSRESSGYQELDLALALSRGRFQQPFPILPSQVGSQQADTAEIESPTRNCREERREVLGAACRLYPLVCRVAREVQPLLAVDMHRGISSREIQLPGVDLGQMGQKEGCDAAIADDESGEIAQKSSVAEMRERVLRHANLDGGGCREQRLISTTAFQAIARGRTPHETSQRGNVFVATRFSPRIAL